jgi:MFS family permease
MTTAAFTAPAEARKEIRTLTIVAIVHLVSHFYWMMLVPLLPSLKELLGVSYVELGYAIFFMNAISALIQAPTGFVVDRFGPRLCLVLGAAIGAAGFLLLAAFPSYPMMFFAGVLIAVGNAVYHPADYSILSAEMSQARMGRAYSMHTFSGYLGFALVPPVMFFFINTLGPRPALVAGALIGFLLCLPLLPEVPAEQRKLRGRAGAARKAKESPWALLTVSVIALTAMFTTLSMSTSMMQTYMVVSLAKLGGFPGGVGENALTAFMITLVIGVLIGGFLADGVKSKSLVTFGGFGAAAAIAVVIASFSFTAFETIALIALMGLVAGLIMPSRDMLVRVVSPPAAVGRVFGIVTTGFNFGGMMGPVLGGWLVDHDMPRLIYLGSAAFMIATILIAIAVEKGGKP